MGKGSGENETAAFYYINQSMGLLSDIGLCYLRYPTCIRYPGATNFGLSLGYYLVCQFV